MPDTSCDKTLPSLGELESARLSRPRYQLTIVFHPDLARIGERAALSFAAAQAEVVGRSSPVFSRPGESTVTCALDDPYISRCAFVIEQAQGGLRLQRESVASRCRVAGRDLVDALYLDGEELAAGVPLLLAHSIVLMLRCVTGEQPGACADCGMIGGSEALYHLREQVLRAASSDADVLLLGETGTGKELVAGAIHHHSRRAARPMISVNMAAVPAALAAASLFGASRGAYTGAARSQPGYFQQAEGGCLFLDEVGDTPEEVQPLLLRALQEREVQVVGGELRRIDVRVISATDVQLDDPDKLFRAALRHRLGALELQLPALRDHPEDIGELLLHFLRAALVKEASQLQLPNLDAAAIEVARWADLFYAFARYPWPGNVRQLGHFAARVVLAGGSQPVIPEELRSALRAHSASAQSEPPAQESGVAEVAKSRRRLVDIAEAEFREVMQDCEFEIATVAQALGVSRQSVYRRIQVSPDFRLAGDVPEVELQRSLRRCDGDLREVARDLRISHSALRARLRNTGPTA
ncbi:sigma-54-dependent Fis family transcriptional regulator [Mangrovimicrobium sediminis]|uniref:Sigma-54-dependent Fis family transcriptional regulator n=1 Tax=Mangrovimicrobium sediminis TaxID=2562682 RepID=A0A4Z0M3D4_9GAMM|nr:sigma 54-interacting transcriptional regulator [Haliea sp. SAOS-164]TGD74039.1 sigma-54-dependent Fis family transcriptional regulator [Haliea sp. SAOS-164]